MTTQEVLLELANLATSPSPKSFISFLKALNRLYSTESGKQEIESIPGVKMFQKYLNHAKEFFGWAEQKVIETVPERAQQALGLDLRKLIADMKAEMLSKIEKANKVEDILDTKLLANTIVEVMKQQESGKVLADVSRAFKAERIGIPFNVFTRQPTAGIGGNIDTLLKRGFQQAKKDYSKIPPFEKDINKQPPAEDPTMSIGGIYARTDNRFKKRVPS